MGSTSLVVGDVPAIAPDASGFRLDCAHGSTSVVLLPGRSPIGEAVALDMLMLRHRRTTGCACADEMPEPHPSPVLMRVTV